MRLSIQNLIFGFFYLFIVFLVFEGPIRYMFAALNANMIVYLPKAFLAFVSFIYLYMYGRTKIGVWYLLIFLMIFIVIGVFNLGLRQSFFEVWVILPFIYGLVFSHYIYNAKYYYWYLGLYWLCVAGVLMGLFIHYPWSGLQVDVLGKAVTANIEWDAMGINRDSGFSRASYSAASQLLCLAVLIIYINKSFLINIAVWFFSGIGIILTTTKGAFVAWGVLSVYYIMYFLFKSCSVAYIYRSIVIIFFGLLCVILPVTTLFHSYSGGFQGIIMKFFLSSFMDRLVWMWPDSFHLLEIGRISSIYFGRGLGGIGASQSYYEPQYYRAADNVFVYMVVNFGIFVSVLFMAYLTIRAFSKGDKHQYLFVVPVIMIVFSYGLVVNIFEEPLLSALVGCILFPYKKYYEESGGLLLKAR